MSKKKTTDEYKEEVSKLHPNIEILSEYINAHSPIIARCKKHDYVFEVNADSILRSVHGCKYCAQDYVVSCVRHTHEKFVTNLGNNIAKYTFLGEYVNAKTPIKTRCNYCGNIWFALPDALNAGCACKKCAMKYVQQLRIKSNEQFLNEIKERNIHSNTFDVLSEYKGDAGFVTCRCKLCGHTWDVRAHNLISKRYATACPICMMSKGETRIMNFLDSHNFLYTRQKEFENLIGLGNRPLRFDFYLPNQNIAIEYQGEFHDNSVPYQTKESYECLKKHDSLKSEYCKNNGIRLIEIWYWDLDNIETILQNLLSEVA